MKLYYAHAICIYRSTTEEDETSRIRRQFPGAEIISPASYENDPEKRRDTLAFCFALIEKTDAVIYTRLFGKVTSGVGAEVNHAPVYELTRDGIRQIKRPLTYLSREATISLYRIWRAKDRGRLISRIRSYSDPD